MNFDGVAVGFSELFPYRFQNADNIADISFFVFNSHIDDAAVIRDTVERRVHLNATLAKLFSDIVRENDVCSAAFRINVYRRGKNI